MGISGTKFMFYSHYTLFGVSFCFIWGETGIKFIEFLRRFLCSICLSSGDFLVALWDFIYSVLSAFVWAWAICV